MKTILATAYAINPYKGSEDGMGWNFVYQIARYQRVIAITRKNNREAIEQFIQEETDEVYQNMTFLYYDLPYWMRFWKKGGRGAMLYFYLWQLCMPIFIWSKRLDFDVAHNLNFHNDWTPSMLWVFGKPFVWGPIGHHPDIPEQFLEVPYGKKEVQKHKRLWWIKQYFWKIDPLLKLTKWKADKVLCMNTSVWDIHPSLKRKSQIMPSVSSEVHQDRRIVTPKFNILSVGRLLPLKGFDITIRAFALFIKKLPKNIQDQVELTIVGSGTHEAFYQQMVQDLGVEENVQFISWIERVELTAIYRQSDVFFFPSHEGAGMVVAEAMSYSLPVLCINNCGPGEFVTEESGIRVPYGSYEATIQAFALQLERLFLDQNLQDRLSEGALARFQNYFDWNVKGEQLCAIYTEVLGTKHKTKTSTTAKL